MQRNMVIVGLRSCWQASLVWGLALALCAGTVAPVMGQDTPESPPDPEVQPEAELRPEETYSVSRFEVVYATRLATGEVHPQLPAPEVLLGTVLRLGRKGDTYFALDPERRPDLIEVRLTVEELYSDPPKIYSESALISICAQLSQEFAARGFLSVIVAPDPAQLYTEDWREAAPTDERPPGDTSLRLLVFTAEATEVRTLAFGTRIPNEDRLNHRKHAHIAANSPVQGPQAEGESGDLIRRDLLDRYVLWLNRHPGRQVNVAIASSGEPGRAVLDYHILENKPWSVYAQVSNTGTEQTSEWRQRVGFFHTQLTGNDDILSFDYVTASFDAAHALIGSYDAPLPGVERTRWKIFGSWNEFTASDVGRTNEEFEGDGWTVGGEIATNVYQRRELFIDIFAGARFENTSVDNIAIDLSGESDFFIPSVGARLDRRTDIDATMASLWFEVNLPDVAGTADQAELDRLGRLAVDDDWMALKWDVSHSMYLEPLLLGDRWGRSGRWQDTTLAHELAFSFRGQYAFDTRMIPQAEQVVGGLYTVRGYPESIAAGDTVYLASAEYRFHLPRILRPYDSFEGEDAPRPREFLGSPFRVRPDQMFSRPDWDLILRGFVDYGRAENSDRQSIERDQDLLGAGVGVELLLRRNLSVRVDWGFVLESIETDNETVDSGDNTLHFVATFQW